MVEALVVDTTVQPIPGGGHRLVLYAGTGRGLRRRRRRLVRQYNPRAEFVVVILKEEGKMSATASGVQTRIDQSRAQVMFSSVRITTTYHEDNDHRPDY